MIEGLRGSIPESRRRSSLILSNHVITLPFSFFFWRLRVEEFYDVQILLHDRNDVTAGLLESFSECEEFRVILALGLCICRRAS